MILLDLFLSFFKIGLFSFGGGYAMIPLIQGEIARHGWMTASQFFDVVAIAEMTPGPIAVNAATFVGYRSAGILGGIVATAGVALPSMILILLVAELMLRYKEHPLKVRVFSVIRPVVASLIFAAALLVGETVMGAGAAGDRIKGGIVMVLCFAATALFKLHPILVILGSGVLGAVLFR